jgi:hypothetical protein
MKLAQRLKISAVFETSAKLGDNEDTTVDDVFFRSILNCYDLRRQPKNTIMSKLD